ncbi:hypothetical protein [Desertihabitans aurantiacus]|uniref:hypothetical protein n=1 Tax=Desertihabitans aurantiacus TaxID=2282477 RepID=UPI0018E4E947|nr:hypothetical protein [Desertihabitans aurantiacus]
MADPRATPARRRWALRLHDPSLVLVASLLLAVAAVVVLSQLVAAPDAAGAVALVVLLAVGAGLVVARSTASDVRRMAAAVLGDDRELLSGLARAQRGGYLLEREWEGVHRAAWTAASEPAPTSTEPVQERLRELLRTARSRAADLRAPSGLSM